MVVWLAAFALFAVDHPAPPRPTDQQLVAELVKARPGAEVLGYSARTFADGRGHAVCGTARIAGQVEPFSVSTLRAPDQWKVLTVAPGGPPADHAASTADWTPRWDALARKQTLNLCPDLKAPEAVIWVTDY